jgi:hypothetical protein
MRFFVGFGYNDRDAWIPELVFPLIRAFDAEVATGEDMQGQQISNEVQRRIESSDGLIAFLTRRGDADQAGVYKTHRWVQDELAYALAKSVRVVEVREEGVDDQGGLPGDRQRITYKEAERDRLMLELAETVGAWVRTATVNLQLLPPEFVDEIRPLLGKPGFRCTYTVRERGRDAPPVETPVLPIKGGLFIEATKLPPQALLRVSVEGNGRLWRSDYEAVDSLSIRLSPE